MSGENLFQYLVVIVVIFLVLVIRKILHMIFDKGGDIVDHKINEHLNKKNEGEWKSLADRYRQTSAGVPMSRKDEQYDSRDKLFCANCGAQLTKTTKFCPMCGAKVEHF